MYVDEVLEANIHLDYITSVKLVSWINKTLLPDDSDGSFEEVVINALTKMESTYEPKKGNLLAYIKTYLRLETKKLHKLNTNLDFHSTLEEQQLHSMSVEMGVFTDLEISSMYRVSVGKGSKEDILIVKGLVDE